MNIMTSNPAFAQQMARQMIDERVRDAEQRRVARAARNRHEQTRTPRPPNSLASLPWWSFRSLRPAH